MKKCIESFLQQRHIAVAGVSRNEKKFGTIVYHHLKERGYNVYAINPFMKEVNGDPVYRTVEDLPDQITAVVAVTKPDQTLQITDALKQKGIDHLWLQRGSFNDAVIARAEEYELNYIAGRCIMMFAEPVKSIHSFHRFFVKLFGNYPK
ncbi:MAG: CoA-binding protein [Bacteroidales bacterium]|nr:CoA-binding protein [Bacteroidales bacterium]